MAQTDSHLRATQSDLGTRRDSRHRARRKRTAFEAFWATALGDDVFYLNSANKLPQTNGDETFRIMDANASLRDGPTYAMQVNRC